MEHSRQVCPIDTGEDLKQQAEHRGRRDTPVTSPALQRVTETLAS